MGAIYNSEDDIFPEAIYEDPHTKSGIELLLYRGTWLTKMFFTSRQVVDNCVNFPIDSSDIVVAGFPKSGTTWLEEIVYRIRTANSKELVSEEVSQNMDLKFPLLEGFYPGADGIAARQSPRFLKTHLSYQLLPKKARDGQGKLIYIARNPKDVCVSFYSFIRGMNGVDYEGELYDMCQLFLNGRISWGPWLDHVKTFWKHRNDPNILFLTYEQLQEKPREIFIQIAKFLDVSMTEDQLEEIFHLTKFEVMKKDDSVNYSWWKKAGQAKEEFEFMRKGIVGDWRNHFTTEMSDDMDRILIQPLKDCGLSLESSEE